MSSTDDDSGRFSARLRELDDVTAAGVDLLTRPDLLAWVSTAAETWSSGDLPADRADALEALLGDETLRDLSWAAQYTRLADYLEGHPDVDLADDIALTRSELAWVRGQQLNPGALTEDQISRLSRLPGWAWRSYHDLLADDDLPGLRYLAHSGEESTRALARLVHLLPVEAVGRMCAVDDDAGQRIVAVLRAASHHTVRDKGLHLSHLAGLLPVEARTEQNLSFLAAHVDHIDDPAVAQTVLAFLCQRAGTGPGHEPHPEHAAPATTTAPTAPSGVVPSRWAMAITHPLAHRHIACLGLSARTHNALLRAEISRVGEILAIEDPATLLELRGFGATCLVDLRQRLVDHGIDPPFDA